MARKFRFGSWLAAGMLAVASAGLLVAQEAGKTPITPKELYKKCSPSIVRVLCLDENGRVRGQGTGFFVSEHGLLITNHHVVNGGASWRVILPDDRTLNVEGIVDSNPDVDLALVQARGKWLPHLRLGDDELPVPGEKVLAIGNPLGLTNTISDGLLSGYRRQPGKPTMLQISAPISPGSSGGPFFVDGDDRVVGVTTSQVNQGQNLNFAVPVSEVTKLLGQSTKRLAHEAGEKTRQLLTAIRENQMDDVKEMVEEGAAFDKPAASSVSGDDESEYVEHTVDSALLKEGANVLAVEIHQQSASSSDLIFDMELDAAQPQAKVLVAKGATWKYNDEGKNLKNAWRKPDFDDKKWKSGPAKLGYGEEDIKTTISFGKDKDKKHLTVYFRHAFDVKDAAAIKGLKLRLLRDDGAVVYLNGRLAVRDNVNFDVDVNGEDEEGRTALHLAASAGDESLIRHLLAASAQVNKQTLLGKTPLDMAIEAKHDKAAAILKDQGARPSAQIKKIEEFLVAARSGDIAKLQALGMSDVNIPNDRGATALHYAVYSGQTQAARWLLEKGAKVKAADADDYQPIHLAALMGQKALATLLLEKGADIEAKGPEGRTPLIDAVMAGQQELAVHLLDKGADIKVKTSNGRSVLHYAVTRKKMASLLIDRGADVNAKDRANFSPLTIAKRLGYEDVAEIIKGKGGKESPEIKPKEVDKKLAGDFSNSIGMGFKKIKPGLFAMGSPDTEAGRSFEDEQFHRVKISKGFSLGVTEVTREQFAQFIKETRYKTDAEKKGNLVITYQGRRMVIPGGSWARHIMPQENNHPVVFVSWNDAVAFCQWLSKKEGKKYRLPTEAEWEYACRAGSNTRFWAGDEAEYLEEAGVAAGEEGVGDPKGTAAVGSLKPNKWGLFDVHGNVYEWTADWFEAFGPDTETDPKGPPEGTKKVRKGGSWMSKPDSCRSANRGSADPATASINVGFRVLLED